MNKKILVAMSGGVDSSVAAHLLLEQGHEVAGITMKLYFEGDETECGHKTAIEDAKKVCDHLGIKHYVMDFSEVLSSKVISKFVEEYKSGKTPNPCIDCNENLKFGLLMSKGRELGYDYFATGHYANIEEKDNNFYLSRARDRKKDQTYFLYRIKYENLSSIIFPLGNHTKNEVRAIAEKIDLPVAKKRESQDICFIPDKDIKKFLGKHISDIQPGPIINKNGKILGEHHGYLFYTIGQRGGLGISHPSPLYVLEIDPANNTLVVGEKADLTARKVLVKNWNQLIQELPERVEGKIRYAHPPSPCSIENISETEKIITFKEPQQAITPGQSLVTYFYDRVIGGGFIKNILS